MILDKLFQVMADRQASDIFICAGAPIHIKIQGNSVPINQQMMDSAMIEKIAAELLNPEQTAAFEKTKEMNLSFGVPNLGNFRINLFRQRASISIVIRYVMGNIPALDSLSLPAVLADLVMERRGLILIVGATGSGKSTTLASMLDHRNTLCSGHILTIEDPDRVSVPAQEVPGQPARDRHGHPGLGKRLEERDAAGTRLHPDRRNPRPGDHAGGDRLRPDRPSVPRHAACQQQLPRAQSGHQLLPAG
jgi:type IV secretory pathway ATPase VirB11/archaellum biosynthesis ATPase